MSHCRNLHWRTEAEHRQHESDANYVQASKMNYYHSDDTGIASLLEQTAAISVPSSKKMIW